MIIINFSKSTNREDAHGKYGPQLRWYQEEVYPRRWKSYFVRTNSLSNDDIASPEKMMVHQDKKSSTISASLTWRLSETAWMQTTMMKISAYRPREFSISAPELHSRRSTLKLNGYSERWCIMPLPCYSFFYLIIFHPFHSYMILN